MLRLNWISNTLKDSEGDSYVGHYLYDELSERCFAIIPEPRQGNLIYSTDIRVAGYDRAYMTLDAAKAYCEGVAIEDDIAGDVNLMALIKEPAEPVKVAA